MSSKLFLRTLDGGVALGVAICQSRLQGLKNFTARSSTRLKIAHFARLTLGIGIVIALLSGVAFAQVSVATISGTVSDASGAAIPNATVTATSEETGATHIGQAGADGHYVILSVPIGLYDVKAEAPSFSPEVQTKLTLTINQEAVINFSLKVGSVNQTVSVEATAPVVDTTSGTLGGLVNEERTADLPLNGRNFTDLTFMQTGVTSNYHPPGAAQVSAGTDITSNGSGQQSTYETLDGAPMKEAEGYSSSSITNTQLGVEGIREFLVITNNLKAEYGMTMGAHVVVATKSGTNQFHGTGFDFLRNSGLDAREFNDPVKIPLFHRENFGGSFGGPIKKDKTFFFATYEGIRQHQGVSTTVDVPTPTVFPASSAPNTALIPAGGGGNGTTPVTVLNAVLPYLALYPAATSCTKVGDVFPYCTGGLGALTDVYDEPTTENYVQGRVDHVFNDKDSIFARYTYDKALQIGASGFAPTKCSPGVGNCWPAYNYSRQEFFTLAENHIFSSSLLNTARYSFTRPEEYFLGYGTGSNQSLAFEPQGQYGAQPTGAVEPSPGGTGLGMGDIGITSGFTTLGPVSTAGTVALQNAHTWSDDLSWTHGAHTFKFGALVNRFTYFENNPSSGTGSFSFTSLTNFLTANANAFQIEIPGGQVDRTIRWWTIGIYAQDDWRVNSRLTVNLGLRYEPNTSVNETTGQAWEIRNVRTDSVSQFLTTSPDDDAVFKNGSLHNFGPRFGFAWDIFGDSKTALRGGAAYLYDIMTAAAGVGIAASAEPPYSGICTFNAPNTFLAFPNTPINSSTCAVPNTIRDMNWNFKQPHTLNFNLTIDRQLPAGADLTVSYVGSRGLNLLAYSDASIPQPQTFQANGLPLFSGITASPTPGVECTPTAGPYFVTGCNPNLNPNFSSIELRGGWASSWYNSLQVAVQKRISHGLQAQLSYTWQHCTDDTEGQVGGEAAGSNSQNEYPAMPYLSYGNCDWDIKNDVVLNLLYTLPTPFASGFAHTATSGWRLGSIATFLTGQPFTVADSGNASRSLNSSYSGFVADLPNVVPGCNPYSGAHPGTTSDYLNPACFTAQPLTYINGLPYGQLGDEGRNQYFGPAMRNWDFSITKDTPLKMLGEAGNVELRAEFFNILNHPDYGLPARSIFNYSQTTACSTAQVAAFTTPGNGTCIPAAATQVGTLGELTTYREPAREIQLALKVIF